MKVNECNPKGKRMKWSKWVKALVLHEMIWWNEHWRWSETMRSDSMNGRVWAMNWNWLNDMKVNEWSEGTELNELTEWKSNQWNVWASRMKHEQSECWMSWTKREANVMAESWMEPLSFFISHPFNALKLNGEWNWMKVRAKWMRVNEM